MPHVTLKSIANNPDIDEIYARMHPAVETALAALNQAMVGWVSDAAAARNPPKAAPIPQHMVGYAMKPLTHPTRVH